MNPEAAPLPQIAQALRDAQRPLIFSHVAPDGDALGSALGLMWLLRAQGSQAELSFEDPVPLSLRFLPGAAEVANRPLADHDLVVALDGSDAGRYGAQFSRALASEVPVLLIDHHKTNTRFAPLHWVDSRYAATAQMIYHLAQHAGWPLAPDAALCLATGCVTDTNGFSTDHTSPALLEAVAELMRGGASLATIMRQAMSLRTAADAALWGRALSTLRVEAGVAWALNRRADRAAVGASEEEGAGLSTFLRNIIGVQVGVLFTEADDGSVRLSLRAEPGYDVGTLAFEMGGGGHTLAAGVTLTQPLAEAVAQSIPRIQRLVETGRRTLGS